MVCPRPEDARQLVTQLDVYFGEESPIFHFPELEVIPYERVTVDRQLEHQRLVCLNALSRHREHPSPLVVTSNIALMQRTIETNQMRELSEVIKTGDRINVEFTLESWANMGYKYEEHVHQKGSFARRGGIIDIFSPQMKLPARLELWGDEIEAIRLFDPLTQRSIRNVEELLVIPAQELLPNYANQDLFNNRYSEMGLASIGTKEQERIAEELADISAGITVQSSSLYSGFFQQNTLLDHIDENENILAVVNEPPETKKTGIDWKKKQMGCLI